MTSLYLRPDSWDLAVTASGDIAVCTAPYALAQDAACAIRTFLGECWYRTDLGIDYFGEVLGRNPPAELVRAKITAEALRVPGVVAAKVYLSDIDREISGTVHVTDSAGVSATAGF